MLNPTFSPAMVRGLMTSAKEVRAYDGNNYVPGVVGQSRYDFEYLVVDHSFLWRSLICENIKQLTKAIFVSIHCTDNAFERLRVIET